MMESLALIEDKIAFTFLEDVSKEGFSNTTESGIIVKQKQENQINIPRWGKAIKCSPNVTDVNVGDYILIEPMGWTPGVELGDVNEDIFWLTTEAKVMVTSDDYPI